MKKQEYYKKMDKGMDKGMDRGMDMDNDIQLFVKSINGKTFSFFVNNNDTILNVKEQIKYRNNIKIDAQRLVYAAKELINEKTIKDYNIQKESTLHLSCQLEGGST